MPYSESVAQQIREVLKKSKEVSERKMFGGLAFMLNGHMCCGVLKEDLVLRLGEAGTKKALTKPHTRLMDFTGKSLKTMVYVEPLGYQGKINLQKWLKASTDFVKTLPPKKAKLP